MEMPKEFQKVFGSFKEKNPLTEREKANEYFKKKGLFHLIIEEKN